MARGVEWPAHHVEYLRANFETQDARQMAEHLGITRNAIIGKARRIGVDLFKAYREREAAKVRTPRVRMAEPSRIRPRNEYIMAMPPDAPTTDRTKFCLEPIGTPGERGFHYCSMPPLFGCNRCPKHSSQ